MTDATVPELMNEIRYAERLCARTARLYRRAQALGTFGTVPGGSGALSALVQQVPPWVSVSGACVFTVFGAAMLAMRPADKAAANEADVRRYAKLRTDGASMDAATLRAALNKARESDTAELEPLRDVAHNDLMIEIGYPAQQVALSPSQRLLAALA